MNDRKIHNYIVGSDGKVRREWLTAAQRDYLKIVVGALNLAIAMLIFVEVYG